MADKTQGESLQWQGNVSLYQHYRLKSGEVLGEAVQPEGSSLSKEQFAERVKDRDLRGVYAPPCPK